MSVFNYLLEQPVVYRLWQAPFASAKLEPLLANNSILTARRVLDVGCGPGTKLCDMVYCKGRAKP